MVNVRSSLALTLALALAGCSSLPNPADVVDKPSPGNYIELASHNKYVDHPSAAVSGPASLGLGIGTLLGIPIMVVALPITLPLGISAFSDDPKVSNLEVLGNAVAFPDAVCAVGGAYAFGSLPYAIVGPAGGSSARAGRPTPPPAADADAPALAPASRVKGKAAESSLPPPPKFSQDELAPN